MRDLDHVARAQEWLDTHRTHHSARKSDVKALIAEVLRLRREIDYLVEGEL